MRGAWFAVLVGCGLPAVDVEGQHVRVAADPGLELCGGTLTHMDRFIARVAEEFGRAPPMGDDRIQFYWLADDFLARSKCPIGAAGCARDGVIYSQTAPHNHELVHALAYPWGPLPPFFGEGLATAFEGEGLSPVAAEWVTNAELLKAETIARSPFSVTYASAGGFVRSLVEAHGIAAVLRTITGLPREPSLADIDAAFRRELDVTLDESLAEYVSFAGACPRDQTAPLLECEAPEIAWDGREIAELRTVACAQEDVIGPFFYTWGNTLVLRTIVVPEDGLYELNVIANEPAVVSLLECGGCGPRVAAHANRGPAAFELSAGLYALRLHGSEPTIDLGWILRRVDE